MEVRKFGLDPSHVRDRHDQHFAAAEGGRRVAPEPPAHLCRAAEQRARWKKAAELAPTREGDIALEKDHQLSLGLVFAAQDSSR